MQFIRDFIEGLVAQYHLGIQDMKLGSIQWLTEDDVPVYCNDDMVVISGCPSRVPGAFTCEDLNNNSVIVVNRRLLDQDQWFIDAVIAHETGHIKLHSGGRCWFNAREEYEADVYAFLDGVEIIRALEFLNNLSGVRLSHRIKRLKAYAEEEVCL